MIVICEPQCKGMSHEKVNSGFIYGLRTAFPQEKILFYADETHLEGIKYILKNDGVRIDNMEYIPIQLHDPYSFRGMISNYNLLKNLYQDVVSAGTDKIFFLSTNPVLLYLMKLLKTNPRFRGVKCTIVCHGEFEDIAFGEYREPPVAVFPAELSMERIRSMSLAERIRRIRSMSPGEIIQKITRVLRYRYLTGVARIKEIYPGLFKRYFYVKKFILWRHTSDFHYIVLSPAALRNAAEYIDIKNLNFYGVVMPIVFAKPLPPPSNEHVKFAVFGYGDSSMTYRTARLLEQKNIKNPYEIRVISMDCRGTEGFPAVHCVSSGKVMTRSEMESHVPDIDIFMILYEKNRYRLSCSNSILEAISYIKPVLYISNDSINYFNSPENPIGFCCADLEEAAEKMADIINNFSSHKGVLQTYRENILSLRDQISIEKLAPTIKSSFTFD